MVSRAVVPSAPPRDEGYGSGSSSSSTGSRGTVRPHSVSPFLRSIRRRLENEGNEEEDIDLEAISCLLDFSTRERGGARPQTPSQSVVTVSSFKIDGTSGTEGSSVMVRTFATSPPATPAAAPRPDRPPVISGRRHSGPLVRPRPLRRSVQEEEEELRRMRHSCHSCVRVGDPLRRNVPPAAALGAPPTQEEEEDREDIELPDLPETPASPATSDLTVIRLVKILCFFFLKKEILFKKYFYVTIVFFVYF